MVSQVRGLLPGGWDATLLAVDGSKTDQVEGQLARLPRDATHIVLSVGGNDALGHLSVWQKPVVSAAQAIEALAQIGSDFETRYRLAFEGCARTGLPLAVCTIYNGCFDDRTIQRLATATLTIFNDAILRVAIEHALPVIDLRAVCARAEDYANPIEPSSVGGEKIARAIVALVCGGPVSAPATRIVAG